MEKDGKIFEAELSKIKDKAVEKTIKNQEEAQKIVDYLQEPSREFEVVKVNKKTMKRNLQLLL